MKRLMILVLLATVTIARADDSKISPELRAAKPGQQTQVIVQYAPGTQLNCSGLLSLLNLDCLLNVIAKTDYKHSLSLLWYAIIRGV